MKITYIEHSGFLAEGKELNCLFDYWKGDLPQLEKEKPLYIFSSHAHHDHFNPEIFRIGEGNPWVRYVLSKDISLSPGKLKQYGIGPDWLDRITRAGSRQHYSLEGLEVDTFRSTDAGVAYAVCMEGTWIYHAGDLNWWTWKDEETEGEYRDMTGRFQEEISLLSGYSFQAAMVPLDPRQGERFYWGMDYFMKHVNTEIVIPMHCWDDYSVVERLKKMECSSDYREKIHSPEEKVINVLDK